MVTRLTPLDEHDLAVVARHTHRLWGGGQALPQYQANLREQCSRAHGKLQLWGLKRGNTLLSSLKGYRLPLRIGPRALTGFGIGAVFTPPQHRGEGAAAQLLHRLMRHQQQRGTHAALLFSDITPGYYQRLGFQQAPAFTWSAQVDKLPTQQPYLFDPYARMDHPTLLALHRQGTHPDELTSNRSVGDFAYWRWRAGSDLLHLIYDGPKRVGYLCSQRRDGRLWIDELVTLPLPRERLHAGLRRLAGQLGCRQVAGWLRPEHAAGCFVASVRSRCIPMLAWLCHTPPAYEGVRLSSLDRF